MKYFIVASGQYFARLLVVRVSLCVLLLAIFSLNGALFSEEIPVIKPVGQKDEKKVGQYSIEETTKLLNSSRLGNLKLDHDDHVYKYMKISRESKDLAGAVAALIEFKIDFGDTLDDEEVSIVIRASRIYTDFLKQIAIDGRKIGKKEATIEELSNIIYLLEHDRGVDLLNGINLANECNYKLENDYLTREKMDLLVNLGKVRDKVRFVNICVAMKKAGMSSKIYTSALETLYKISLIDGDVANKIVNYLKENKWESRNQPGSREYAVIRDLMKLDYSAYYDKKSQAMEAVNRKKPKKGAPRDKGEANEPADKE